MEEVGPGKEASSMCPGESVFDPLHTSEGWLWGSEGRRELWTQKAELGELPESHYHFSLRELYALQAGDTMIRCTGRQEASVRGLATPGLGSGIGWG